MATVRRPTLQGGNGRSTTTGGVPNLLGQGITQRYLGGNPPGRNTARNQNQPYGYMMSLGRPYQNGLPKFGGNVHQGGLFPHPPNLGGGFHPGTWMPSTFPGGNTHPGKPGGGQGGGGNQGGGNGGGGNQGGGQPPPNPFDPNAINDVLNGTGDYANLMRKLGMPLDPQFMAERTMLVNNRDSALSQLLNQFNVGNAQLDQQNVLGQRSIASNDAARGLYGSGIQVRDNRLLGNDIATQRLGLQGSYDQGTLGANQDYRGQMMQSLMDLATRLQGQQNLPLPTWGPWAMGNNRQQQSQTPPLHPRAR